jgi:ribosomal protein S18 acetylase RimI-like enzyme
MTQALLYAVNKSDSATIAAHLRACDRGFVPLLSERVDIDDYARKIEGNAQRFEALAGSKLVGFIAAYCNDRRKVNAFVTSVSVLPDWQRQGIAAKLLETCVEAIRTLAFERIELEVDERSTPAVTLYERFGFRRMSTKDQIVIMELKLAKEDAGG